MRCAKCGREMSSYYWLSTRVGQAYLAVDEAVCSDCYHKAKAERQKEAS